MDGLEVHAMTFEEAKIVLKEYVTDRGLEWQRDQCLQFLNYWSGLGNDATLDGEFTADELEAIAVFMRATSGMAKR